MLFHFKISKSIIENKMKWGKQNALHSMAIIANMAESTEDANNNAVKDTAAVSIYKVI